MWIDLEKEDIATILTSLKRSEKFFEDSDNYKGLVEHLEQYADDVEISEPETLCAAEGNMTAWDRNR